MPLVSGLIPGHFGNSDYLSYQKKKAKAFRSIGRLALFFS